MRRPQPTATANPDAPLYDVTLHHIDESATSLERFLWYIPVIGWNLADSMWVQRVRPIRERLESQLQARTPVDPSVWSDDPLRRQIAEVVYSVAKEQMGWSNDHYREHDPARTVFWSYEDGLDAVEAFMQIEDELGVKVSDEEWMSLLNEATLGEVVDFLTSKRQKAA